MTSKVKQKKLSLTKNSRDYLIRFALFLAIYAFFSIFRDALLISRYHYTSITINAPILQYFTPTLLVFFTVFRWKKLEKHRRYKNSIIQTSIFILLGIWLMLRPVSFIYVAHPRNPIISYYLPYILATASFFLAFFNLKFIKSFYEDVVLMLLLLFIYLIITVVLTQYWQFFSYIITYSLNLILPIFVDNFSIDFSKFLLTVKGFSVVIGPPCTGLYSVFTFILLLAMSLFLLNKRYKIDALKSFWLFLTGTILVFLFNILRIVIIILVGAFISRDLALNLFHEYLSAIFLLAIFSFFMFKLVPKVVKSKR